MHPVQFDFYFRQVAADAAAKVLSNGDNIPKILDGLNLEKDEATAPPSTPTREGDVEKDVSTQYFSKNSSHIIDCFSPLELKILWEKIAHTKKWILLLGANICIT